MRKQFLYLSLAIMISSLTACVPAGKKTGGQTVLSPSTTLASRVPATASAALAVKTDFQPAQKINSKEIKDLETALKTGLPIVVKLGTDSCPPCRTMKPIVAELAIEQDGKIVFLDIDVYARRDLAKEFGVRVIPTIVFFDRHGNTKAKSEGAMDKEQLLRAVTELGLNK